MRRHPRVIALSDLLGDDMAFAYLIALWSWTCEFAPEGRIKGPNLCRLIERETGWRGEAGRLYQSLSSEGWLERVSDTEVTVGGWDKYQLPHIERAQKEALRLRDYRAKLRQKCDDTSTRTSTGIERTAYETEYGTAYSTHDVQGKRRGEEKREEKNKILAPPKSEDAGDKVKTFTLDAEPSKPKRGRPPKNPELHARMKIDGDRWMARVRGIVGLSEEDFRWNTAHYLTWKRLYQRYGIDKLMLALDGLENDKFSRTGTLGWFVSENAYQKGLAGKAQRDEKFGVNLEETWERYFAEEAAKKEAAANE